MNKIYKVIWNATLCTWVAVSEIAKGKTKNSVSIGQTVLVDNSYTAQLDKEFSYKKLLLAIFTVFTANFAHAGYYAGNNGGCGGATELADTVAIGSAGGNGAGTSGSPATGGGNIVGNAACVYSPAAMAIGNNARAYSYSSIAIGSGAQAGQLSQANGTSHGADGNGLNGSSAMAIGNDAKAIGIGTTAIGRLAQTNADRTTVIGTQSYIKNSGSTNSIIIGNNTEIGDITTAVTNATAIGQGGKILATGGTTVGQGAEVSIAGSVAIGQGAKTTAIGGAGFLTGSTAPASVVSVGGGTTTATRRIQNLADGANAQDAVTVAQLDKAYDDAHNNLKNVLGGNATYNAATNTYTAPTNIGGTNKNTIDEAISSVKGAAETPMTFVGNARNSGDTKDVERKLGESLKISGAATTAGTYSGANVKTVTDQTGSIAIQIADAPNFAGTVTSTGQQVNGNSVVTGTSTIGSGANAVTLSGTANGLDVGGKKITNVAAPTLGSDATNKTYVDGKVQTLADTPLGFVGDSGTKATRKLGEDLNVKGGATGTLTNGNIGVVSNGSNQLDIKLAETVNLGTNGSVTTGNTKIDNSGLTITGGPSVTSTGINAGSKVITNVAAGSAATDAVNKGQLDSSLANANSNAAVVYTDAAGDKVTKAADGKWYAATDVNADGSLIGSPSEVAAANIITSVQNANGSTTTATKLSNVAAGSVTASSTDAINGSQLYALGTGVQNIIGGTTTYDPTTGTYVNNNIGNTGKNNINDAIASVNAAATKAKTTVTAGSNVVVTPTTNADGSSNYEVAVANDLNVNSVTSNVVTVGSVKIDKTHVDAASKTIISGVGKGELSSTSTDAVNGSQLYALGTGVQNIIGGTTTYDPTTGTYVNNNIGNTGTNNINDAIASVNAAATKAKTTVTAGSNVVVTPTTNADGSSTYEVAVANDLNVNSVTSNVVTVGSVKIDKTHVDAASKTIISGVGKGELSSTSTDAVNGSQLYATNQKVTQNTTDITNINTTLDKGLNFSADSGTTVNRKLGDTVAITGDKNIVTTTTANGVQIKLSDNIDVNNVNVSQSITVAEGATVNMGGNKVTNVAAGTADTDAVNVAQMNKAIGGITQNVSNLYGKIDGAVKDANAGIAGAMASAGVPQAYMPGKSMVAASGSTYRGATALAIGVSTITDSGKWVFKGTVNSNSRGYVGATIGAGYQW